MIVGCDFHSRFRVWHPAPVSLSHVLLNSGCSLIVIVDLYRVIEGEVRAEKIRVNRGQTVGRGTPQGHTLTESARVQAEPTTVPKECSSDASSPTQLATA